jgi:hypothetical protein
MIQDNCSVISKPSFNMTGRIMSAKYFLYRKTKVGQNGLKLVPQIPQELTSGG